MDKMIFTDEQGNEVEFNVLFTINHEITGELYAFFAEANTQRPQVLVYKVDEEGKLIDLNEEELEYAQNVFNAYIARNYGGCGGCHGGCGSHDCECGDDCECDCE